MTRKKDPSKGPVAVHVEWSDADIVLLTKLWGDGLSASQIATELGNGRTRNSVIGKVNRLKINITSARAGQKAAKATGAPARAPKAPRLKVEGKVARIPKRTEGGDLPPMVKLEDVRQDAWEALPYTRPVGLLPRTGCCWPIGDKPLFCNAPTTNRATYCDKHKARATRFAA